MKTKLEKILKLCEKNHQPELEAMMEDPNAWMEYMCDIASGGNHDDTFAAGETSGASDLAGAIIKLLKEE